MRAASSIRTIALERPITWHAFSIRAIVSEILRRLKIVSSDWFNGSPLSRCAISVVRFAVSKCMIFFDLLLIDLELDR